MKEIRKKEKKRRKKKEGKKKKEKKRKNPHLPFHRTLCDAAKCYLVPKKAMKMIGAFIFVEWGFGEKRGGKIIFHIVDVRYEFSILPLFSSF